MGRKIDTKQAAKGSQQQKHSGEERFRSYSENKM